MPDDLFDPLKDGRGPTVYVGANIPRKLNQLLQEEAQREMVTRNNVIRWALADRYARVQEGNAVKVGNLPYAP